MSTALVHFTDAHLDDIGGMIGAEDMKSLVDLLQSKKVPVSSFGIGPRIDGNQRGLRQLCALASARRQRFIYARQTDANGL